MDNQTQQPQPPVPPQPVSVTPQQGIQQLQQEPVKQVETVVEKPRNLTSILLRVGLIFVFAWAAVYGFLNPQVYIHYMPEFVENFMPRVIALKLFAGYEVLLCIFLASGKKILYSGLLAAITLAAITLSNVADFAILFRNVAIFFSALALASIGWKEDRPFKK
jgi:hypothetical protein